jgi:hypothetical protein
MAADTSGWQNFYLMVGGAAAALTGLIFVAVSLHTNAIMAQPLHRDRAFVSIQSLLAVVFLSAAVLVPGQSNLALGLEVELVAVYFVIRTVYFARLMGSAGPQARSRATFTGWRSGPCGCCGSSLSSRVGSRC